MPNMYVATGFKKWGMTFSNVASNILVDKILGNDNEYSDIFDSTRLHPIQNKEEMGNMIKEATSETPDGLPTLWLQPESNNTSFPLSLAILAERVGCSALIYIPEKRL